MEHVPRRVARWLVLPLVLAASAVVWATPAEASQLLGDHAAARGKFFGAALNPNLLNNTQYRNIAATEFNQITPENHMKWDTVQPSQGNFNFSGADQVVNFAQQNGQEVHGHTLVWHSQTAGWVQGLNGTQMRTAMQNHINALVGRYASNPTVVSWDVVNEPLEENGQPRSSFWANQMGYPGFIDDAFRFARAADSNATLCINDFNIDGLGTKSNAYFTLVQGMLSRGVPINCIGFQGHLAVQFGFPSQVQQNLQRFANLGLEVRITELDVRIPLPADSNELNTQAQYYTNMINACLAVSACSGVTVWGVDDGNSWVPGVFGGEGDALLWNAQFQRKAVYNTVHNVLSSGQPPPPPPPPPGPPPPPPPPPPPGPPPPPPPPPPPGPPPPPPPGPGGCSVNATTQTQWGQGYVIQPVTITNGGSARTSWTVTFTLPSGHSVVNNWNAQFSISGSTVTARNMPYNGNLGPGGTTTFGFQVNRPNGNSQLPSGYTCS